MNIEGVYKTQNALTLNDYTRTNKPIIGTVSHSTSLKLVRWWPRNQTFKN